MSTKRLEHLKEGEKIDVKVNYTANSPELRQCLSQSGTTWQGGECVIILNK